MTSNFSLIGFDLGEAKTIGALLSGGRFDVQRIDFGGIDYILVSDGHGAELWLAMEGQSLRSMNPMFTAAPPCLVTVDAVPFPAPDYAAFEAKLDLTLWQDGEVATRMRAFSVNIPERIMVRRGMLKFLKAPQPSPVTEYATTPVEARICVFSYQTEVCADEDALQAALEEHELNLAPGSFIPEGMFGQDPSFRGLYGFGVGKVVKAGAVTDGFSGLPYNWAVITTVGGSFSVVWTPEDAPAACPGGWLIFRGPMAIRAVAPFWQAAAR